MRPFILVSTLLYAGFAGAAVLAGSTEASLSGRGSLRSLNDSPRGILVDLIRSAPTLSGVELKDVGSNTTIYLFGSPSEVSTTVSSLSKACPLANNCLIKNHIPAPLIESENGFVFLKKGSGFIAYRVEGRILPFEDLSSLRPSVNTTAFGCVGDTLRSTSFLGSSPPESPSKEESSTSPAILEVLAIFFLIVMVILYLIVGGLLVC